MKDKEAPEQLLLQLYTRLGLDSALATLQESGLNPLLGKLMITAVALVVGIGGVWVLFWVANDLIGRLPFRRAGTDTAVCLCRPSHSAA